MMNNNTSDKVRKEAAKEYIKDLILSTKCDFILEGMKKKEEDVLETICKLISTISPTPPKI